MSNSYIEIVNTAINPYFTNANNYDLIIRTDTVNQKLLLGNGSNTSIAGITLSNNIVTLAYSPRYTPATCIIYPSLTKSYTSTYYDYLVFGSVSVSDNSYFSYNIDPTNSYNNTVTFLKPGYYSIYIQVTPASITGTRVGYSINYFHAPIAVDGWNSIPFYASNNGSGGVCVPVWGGNDYTKIAQDIYQANTNDVFRVLLQWIATTNTLNGYTSGPQNGTSKVIITRIG